MCGQWDLESSLSLLSSLLAAWRNRKVVTLGSEAVFVGDVGDGVDLRKIVNSSGRVHNDGHSDVYHLSILNISNDQCCHLSI